MTVWQDLAAGALAGTPVTKPPENDDFPPPGPVSVEDWRATVERFEASHAALRQKLDALSDERLVEKSPCGRFPLFGLLHGVIQHTTYHLGQVALLTQMLRSNS